jgi:hypothetical protein
MRITIRQREEWREPILAAVEECYDETVERTGRRGVRWILHDRKQFETLKRLADGTACAECMEVFPERPSASSVKRFAEVYDKPGQVLPWRQRVMQGCCPVCGAEVSTEYFQALHQGLLPKIPPIEER